MIAVFSHILDVEKVSDTSSNSINSWHVHFAKRGDPSFRIMYWSGHTPAERVANLRVLTVTSSQRLLGWFQPQKSTDFMAFLFLKILYLFFSKKIVIFPKLSCKMCLCFSIFSQKMSCQNPGLIPWHWATLDFACQKSTRKNPADPRTRYFLASKLTPCDIAARYRKMR